jgi:hypothetical protein
MKNYEQIRLEELWEFDSVLSYIGYCGWIATLY